MKTQGNIKYKNSILGSLLFIVLAGCGDMFSDPLVDKETGEDINFLLIDFNFFTTRMTYKFIDVSSNEAILQDATLWFTGNNANDIVTFSGNKEAEHHTSEGQLELTVDPNVAISSSTPLDFTVHVLVNGYDEFSQTIQINSEGKKTFELFLSPTDSGNEEVLTGNENPDDGDSFIFMNFNTKSAVADEKPYRINYSIQKADILLFRDSSGQPLFSSLEEMMSAYISDPSNFLKLTMDINTGFPSFSGKVWVNEVRESGLIQKLESGNMVSLVIGGKKVTDLNGGKITQSCSYLATPEPDVFGFAKIVNEAWQLSQTPVIWTDLEISYTLASVSLADICANGCTIKFSSSAESSFSIDADIYNESGQRVLTTNFKGSFPESFTLENVPGIPARIVFRNNNPGFKEIQALEVSSLCNGNYEVEVQAADDYQEFMVVLHARCADNPSVALAPTYSGEMRIKNSNDPWQGVDMVGGVVDILAKEHQEYEIRFLWQDNWETDSFSTEFDSDGNYLGESASKISSQQMEDGRIKILIEHIFNQDVCNDMNW